MMQSYKERLIAIHISRLWISLAMSSSAARLGLSPESPLAFSHTIHQQPGILEVFLALTFRPGDSHCFHIDPKSSDTTTKAMESIISCYNQRYPNTTMFAVPHPVPVYWGHFSILEVYIILLFTNWFMCNVSIFTCSFY